MAKKAVMNSALAKALIEAGVTHFDDGGAVGPAPTSSGDAGFLGDLFGQSKYSANLAPLQTTNFQPMIGGAYGNYGNVLTQQQALAQALMARANGQAPSPAAAALNQATGANVANTAATMANARGASANPGMIARLAAEQGANTEQQAAGQAATLQAQEQLNAEGAAGNLYNQMQGANEGVMGTAVGGQNAQNNANIANYGMVQGINSGVAEKNAQNGSLGGILGGITSGIGQAAGGLSKMFPAAAAVAAAKGGEIPEKSRIELPDHLHKLASIYHPDFSRGVRDFRAGGPVPGRAAVQGDSARNDTVPALLSPGEEVLPRSVTQAQNAPARAAEFVRHLQKKKEAQTGYSKVAESKKSLQERVARLEKLCMGGSA